MNTVSPSLQLLYVCVVGEGKEREIQQAPGLFQAARNNMLTPQHGIKRASKQTSCARGVFLRFSNRVFKRKVGLGVYARERTTCALKFLKQVGCHNLTLLCFCFISGYFLLFCFSF